MDINNPLIHNVANIGGSFLKPKTVEEQNIRRKYGGWFFGIFIVLLFSYYGLKLLLSNIYYNEISDNSNTESTQHSSVSNKPSRHSDGSGEVSLHLEGSGEVSRHSLTDE